MNKLLEYLQNSYTAYQAVENAEILLRANGFIRLYESDAWKIADGGKYYVVRGGSALVAFTVNSGNAYKIIASHTDSPCLKLKENPITESAGAKRLNVETYGGSLLYTFFDRPLKIAGQIVREKDGTLVRENVVSDYQVVIPSLAIHMNREANEKFAPNPQIDLLPLLSLSDARFEQIAGDCVSYDLYAVCAETPFTSGLNGEMISSPRIDNLTSVYSSLTALIEANPCAGICVAACLDNEEVGSQTRQGAGSDFLSATLTRIAQARGVQGEDYLRALSTSFLISLDNAHAIHPNRTEKCDPTNKITMGGGVVIKGHANKAYTTDALSSSIIKTVFKRANVKYQTFFNRSDMRSGSTLGAISLGQVSVPSVDLGLAQLAMHSAVETFAKSDYVELMNGLTAFYQSDIRIEDDCVKIN